MTNKFQRGRVFLKIPSVSITEEMVNNSTSKVKEDMPYNSVTKEHMLETIEPVDNVFGKFGWLTAGQAITELAGPNWGMFSGSEPKIRDDNLGTKVVDTFNDIITFEGKSPEVAAFDPTLTAKAIWEIKRISKRGNELITEFAGNGGNDQIWDDRISLFDLFPVTNKFSLILDAVDDFIDFGNDSGLDFEGTDPFSVSVWVKPEALGFRIIFSKWATSKGYNLQFTNTRKLRMTIAASGGNQILMESSLLMTLSQWYHIVITYDGSENASGVKMYFDSVLDPSLSALVDSLSATIKNSSSFMMGKRDATQFFSGNFSQGAVSGKELPQADVDELYNGGSHHCLYATNVYKDLISWWDIDSFPTIIDRIGPNEGTATNMDAEDVVEDVP